MSTQMTLYDYNKILCDLNHNSEIKLIINEDEKMSPECEELEEIRREVKAGKKWIVMLLPKNLDYKIIYSDKATKNLKNS
ncbi:MAG: hypothetical protein LBB45_09375 [Methanobrevibacter sp.]|jgi:hypothetical protein|nr:hypothetical protein [Candidatus Methanovirga basalitermitum]